MVYSKLQFLHGKLFSSNIPYEIDLSLFPVTRRPILLIDNRSSFICKTHKVVNYTKFSFSGSVLYGITPNVVSIRWQCMRNFALVKPKGVYVP